MAGDTEMGSFLPESVKELYLNQFGYFLLIHTVGRGRNLALLLKGIFKLTINLTTKLGYF